MKVAYEWGERIPLGIIYRNDRTAFEGNFAPLREGPLVGRDLDKGKLAEIMKAFA
jgi:2-oxoglutarate ferredoxin oxidoreductase subunit beta